MHAAPAFRMDDQAELAAFIEARHFATLVVAGENGPAGGAHSDDPEPRRGGRAGLAGRPCRAQQSAGGHRRRSGAPALAIFTGADAYVTPSLYLSKREHGKVVPTWNYMAVARDAAPSRRSTTPTSLLDQVSRITDMMEQPTAAPWKVSDAPEDYIAQDAGRDHRRPPDDQRHRRHRASSRRTGRTATAPACSTASLTRHDHGARATRGRDDEEG